MGIILNASFAQMPDFLLGWFGIDYAGDDGRKFGHWPWESAETAVPERPPAEEMPKAEAKARVEGKEDARRKPVEGPPRKTDAKAAPERPAPPKDPPRGLVKEPANELDAQP